MKQTNKIKSKHPTTLIDLLASDWKKVLGKHNPSEIYHKIKYSEPWQERIVEISAWTALYTLRLPEVSSYLAYVALSDFDKEIGCLAFQKYWASTKDHSWHIMLKTHFLTCIFILSAMDIFSLSCCYSIIKAHDQALVETGKKWTVKNIIFSVFS